MNEHEELLAARSTAYVLGEMTVEQSEAFEAELQESADLRAEVEEVRAMSELLKGEFERGDVMLPGSFKKAIEDAAAKQSAAKTAENNAGPKGELIELPVKPVRKRRWGAWALLAATLGALSMGVFATNSMRTPSPTGYRTDISYVQAPVPLAAAPAPYPQKEGQTDSPRMAKGKMDFWGAAPPPPPGTEALQHNTNAFDHYAENPFMRVSVEPRSTFSIDVDTASYALVRAQIEAGRRPDKGSVRIEELVNYFSYNYPQPQGEHPFSVSLDMAAAPWAPSHKLVRIGLMGKRVTLEQQDGVNLVFLVDTSGSMAGPNRLPLVVEGLKLLVNKLGDRDRIAIVTYAGSAGLVLPSTPVSRKSEILAALGRLNAGGSTNGGEGIDLAYKVAAGNFMRGGVNRVILATDGDFNVGTTSQDALVDMVQQKAKTGVFLSVLGFGMGNYKDSTLEKIADKGNGNYAFVDNATEARRVLVEGLGTLVTIAKDVKLQVEFNPAEVEAFRLIGYENRVMAHQDFNDDKKDAGELGSEHTVTALYEIVPKGGTVQGAAVDSLKYQERPEPGGNAVKGEILTVKLRYKAPEGNESRLLEQVLKNGDDSASPDFKFAAAVASFGMLLRGSEHKGASTWSGVLDLAEAGAASDETGRRRELIALVKKASELR
jgi:Ca-activated chloride channel family protein